MVFGLFFHARSAEALPSGFGQRTVAQVTEPTALDFTPDGRMLVTSKPGWLYVVDGGNKSVALDLGSTVCSGSERGLLGVAVDPDFREVGRKYVYLYYSFDKSGACSVSGNRVSRFTMSGNTVQPGSEMFLLNNIPLPTGNHEGGDVKFGKDKLLYVSVGDGGCDYAAILVARARTTPHATGTSYSAKSCASGVTAESPPPTLIREQEAADAT